MPINVVKSFGEKVRLYRGKFGITQEELGFKSGLDRTYISGIERGIRNPSITSASKIVEALGVSLIDFFKPQKIYTFKRGKYRSPEEIAALYHRKINLLLQGRNLNQLYDEEKQVYAKLRAASLYDPRIPDVYFFSPESARLGKKIAEKLENMEEEEFLGTRYPYFWLDEMKDSFFKISIEEEN